MLMELWVSRKVKPQIWSQTRCRTLLSNILRMVRPLAPPPLPPSCRMYIMCTRRLKRSLNSPETRKARERKVVGEIIKKYDKNVEREKDEKMKVKFPCKLCGDDHLTDKCPQMEEAWCLMNFKQQKQQLVVLNNPFPRGQNLQDLSQ
jgi:hypothetical protein